MRRKNFAVGFGECFTQYGVRTREKICHGLRVFRFGPHECHARCGWQAERFTIRQRRVGESGVVVGEQRMKHRMIGEFGLNHHLARQRVSPRSTCDLRQERKQIFLRPKIC